MSTSNTTHEGLLTQKTLALLLVAILWLVSLACCTTVVIMQPDFAAWAAGIGIFLIAWFSILFAVIFGVPE